MHCMSSMDAWMDAVHYVAQQDMHVQWSGTFNFKSLLVQWTLGYPDLDYLVPLHYYLGVN